MSTNATLNVLGIDLEPREQWCFCTRRCKEALEAGVAPLVVLRATHERALDVVTLEQLRSRVYAH